MYLRPKQDYIDEYDRETVRLGRELDALEKHWKDEVTEKGTKRSVKELGIKMMMYYRSSMLTGERWSEKKRVIEERMRHDQARDTMLATAEAPEHIQCLSCGGLMRLDIKEIHELPKDGKEHVLFFFECPHNCKQRRAFFDTGDEFRPKPAECPKCHAKVVMTRRRENDVITITETCSSCGHEDVMRFDISLKKPEPDPNFMQDYERFCLTDEKGKEYMLEKAGWEVEAATYRRREEDKERKKLLEEISKIKRLTIYDMEQFLGAALEKEKCGRLHLGVPEIRKGIIVPFTIQNLKPGEIEFKAINQLQKTIVSALAPTNWRLMSDGIFNQLGILSGRLRGYDSERDLIELVLKKEKEKPTSESS